MNAAGHGMKRPNSVRIAAGLVLVGIVLSVAETAVEYLAVADAVDSTAVNAPLALAFYASLVINGLFLWGIWTGKALALQLVRLFYPFGVLAGCLQLAAVFALMLPPAALAVAVLWIVVQTLTYLFAFIYVGRPESREFFNVLCHKCNSKKTRATSFLYTSSRCLSCGHRWSHNVRPDRLAPTAR